MKPIIGLRRSPELDGGETLQTSENRNAQVTSGHGVSLGEAFRVWLRVAALSFGGPAGQIAVMHRILVEEKRWISESRFLHALNYCMLLPGPEAQQLATYVGWLMHRTLGGIMAGGLFILPGIIAIMGLSWIYALYGKVGFVSALFFGLKAAVLAIVLEAVMRIGKRALKNRILIGLAAAAFVAIFFLDAPFPLIILAAGLIGFFGGRAGRPQFEVSGHGSRDGDGDNLLGEHLPVHAKPNAGRSLRIAAAWLALWLVPVVALLLLLGGGNVFSQIAVFFSKMAMVTFGGAYAVLAYVAQQAVEIYGWLQPGEMLDGLGMAETTPGPLIMVLQFVGFMAAFRDAGSLHPLLAGTMGGLLATWVTFTPCFLWIFLGAPYIEILRGNRALSGALSAITAAVVGVILNLAIWFGIHTIFKEVHPIEWGILSFDAPVWASLNIWALILSATAIVAMFRFKIGMLPTLAATSVAGIALYGAGAIA
ncbi:chromate efflux transporter [Microvirga sp. BT689]|uniref:chromate efflux transporter n=1 Tax=Microvirga arvi TaxID=2778731 RepID=UPI00194FD5A9|nr:chromate efflux transporter [Microvirga arvi]MBM6580076.1 chromate efflux transporter [Microvirga arvi]